MSEKIVAGWFVANVVLVGIYDLTVLFFFPNRSSVSLIIYQWGKEYPTLYLVLGIMLGHLIFPLRVRNGP